MTITRLTGLLATLLLLVVTGPATAMSVDIFDSSRNVAGTTFFSPAGEEAEVPYYRNRGLNFFDGLDGNWGWTHTGLTTVGFGSASLSISAWDVDSTSTITNPMTGLLFEDEIDEIQGYNDDTNMWETIGDLSGSSRATSITAFSLDSSWFDEIATGLQLRILIDKSDTNFWGVSLSQSMLTLNPLNPVPVPAAVWLFGSALLGLAGFSRRKKNV